MPLVEFKNVSVSLGGRLALDNITASIDDKKFTVIFGPNGAGKSTLLKLIIGQLTPESGSITLLGGSVEENRHHIGYVPQNFFAKKSFPLSVRKAVLTGRYGSRIGWFKKASDEDFKKVDEAIQMVGLSHLAERTLEDLSGGELQRVFMARALASEPKLLLLDEAASGVDVGVKESLYDLLGRLKDKMAIIFVSHDMSVLSKGVDSILCLDRRLVSHGKPEEALNNSSLHAMYGEQIFAFSHCQMPHVHVAGHCSHDHDGGEK
jgi:zinc transport system ATP-binding protein